MRRRIRIIASIAIALVLSSTLVVTVSAQASRRPFKEGEVESVSYIRTLPGQQENYLRYIFGDYAKLMKAQKESGMITGWGVALSAPRGPDDANVVLTVRYANMAALDNLDDRGDAIGKAVLNYTPEQATAASVQRGQMRRQVGSELRRIMVASQ
jgi:hypothetical protein